MDDTEKRLQKIEDQVEEFISQTLSNPREDSQLLGLLSGPESRAHIKRIGTSVLATKWGVGYPGGGFVQAIVNNQLMESFSRADSINSKCIGFYCKLIYNASPV